MRLVGGWPLGGRTMIFALTPVIELIAEFFAALLDAAYTGTGYDKRPDWWFIVVTFAAIAIIAIIILMVASTTPAPR